MLKMFKYKGQWSIKGKNIDPLGIKLLLLEYNELLTLVTNKSKKIGSANNQPQLLKMYKIKLNIEGFENKTFTNLFYKLQTKQLLEEVWSDFGNIIHKKK